MKILLTLLASASLLFAAEPAPQKPDAAFFTKLRLAQLENPGFIQLWSASPERQTIVQTYEVQNFPRFMELSAKWLEKCPVDADMHAMRSNAANHLGDAKAYVYHLYFAMGLMQSLMESGDGTTSETAWKVISIAEEYTLLREIGAQILSRALTVDKRDAVRVKLPDGEEKTYYFDVTLSMEWQHKKGTGAFEKKPDDR